MKKVNNKYQKPQIKKKKSKILGRKFSDKDFDLVSLMAMANK